MDGTKLNKEEKIKIKIQQLLISDKVLFELLNQKMPIVSAYKFNKFINVLNQHLDPYYKSIQRILDDYGITELQDPAGIKNKELKKKMEKAINEANQLLNSEVEISFEKFKVKELGDLQITPAQFTAISYLFE